MCFEKISVVTKSKAVLESAIFSVSAMRLLENHNLFSKVLSKYVTMEEMATVNILKPGLCSQSKL